VLEAPTSFNTVLWRVVAMTPTGCYEGLYSLLDARPEVRFDRFDRGAPLYDALKGYWHVERIAWFTDGFFAMSQHCDQVLISDLRMGREPAYMFSFIVGKPIAGIVHPVHEPRWSQVQGPVPPKSRRTKWRSRRARPTGRPGGAQRPRQRSNRLPAEPPASPNRRRRGPSRRAASNSRHRRAATRGAGACGRPTSR
jgi:inner membrane protein